MQTENKNASSITKVREKIKTALAEKAPVPAPTLPNQMTQLEVTQLALADSQISDANVRALLARQNRQTLVNSLISKYNVGPHDRFDQATGVITRVAAPPVFPAPDKKTKPAK